VIATLPFTIISVVLSFDRVSGVRPLKKIMPADRDEVGCADKEFK